MSEFQYAHQKEDTKWQANKYGITTTIIRNHHRYYLLGVYNSLETARYWSKGDEYNPNGFVKTVHHNDNKHVGFAVYTYYPQEE
jgi:hypothetical protein